MFAEAIDEANHCGRDTWAVTYTTRNGRKIRLIVGHLIVCTLGNGRIWMALDERLLSSTNHISLLERSGDWEWDVDRYRKYPTIQSRSGYYSPSEKHAEVWSRIRPLHFESISKAANYRAMDPRTPEGHSPEILEYIIKELGRQLLDPLY